MTLAPSNNPLYNFTIDIYLIKEAIEGDKTFKKIYERALNDIHNILENKIDFYAVNSRTFDLVALATRDYPNEFKKHDSNLQNLLKIMEENNKTTKF